jgi:hypothetical protein
MFIFAPIDLRLLAGSEAQFVWINKHFILKLINKENDFLAIPL